MKIIKSVSELKAFRKTQSGKVGFVATMGALHEGHGSLLQKAREENDIVYLSIFVNPTQFNNPEDLKKYPRTWEDDLKMAEKYKVDFVFAPEFNDLYHDNYRFQLGEKDFSLRLCGAHRPGHFDGVLTVVMKLLNIVSPTKAYFGEKDFQQLSLIRDMVKTFFMDVEIVPCATVREADGLAMSSRNRRLLPQDREKAPLIYKLANSEKAAADVARKLKGNGFDVDYVEDHGNRRFIAASLGGVRLIDNVEI